MELFKMDEQAVADEEEPLGLRKKQECCQYLSGCNYTDNIQAKNYNRYTTADKLSHTLADVRVLATIMLHVVHAPIIHAIQHVI